MLDLKVVSDDGEEHGNYYSIWGLYRDNGKTTQLLFRVWVYCFTDLKCWIKLLAWGSGVLSGMRSDVLCGVLRMYFILRVPLAYR